MSQRRIPPLTGSNLEAAREWLLDVFPQQEDDVREADAQLVTDNVARFYDGGLSAFLLTCDGPAALEIQGPGGPIDLEELRRDADKIRGEEPAADLLRGPTKEEAAMLAKAIGHAPANAPAGWETVETSTDDDTPARDAAVLETHADLAESLRVIASRCWNLSRQAALAGVGEGVDWPAEVARWHQTLHGVADVLDPEGKAHCPPRE